MYTLGISVLLSMTQKRIAQNLLKIHWNPAQISLLNMLKNHTKHAVNIESKIHSNHDA